MNRRTFPLAVLLVVCFVPALAPSHSAGETDADTAPEVTLPLTFQKVWYRRDTKGGIGGGSAKGDLTLTPHDLKFATSKKEFDLPLESVHILGRGRMRGDVNTEWVLVIVEQSGARRTYGFRDGSKFGYGTKTRTIYDTLRAVFRQLGVAQYSVPEGFRSFDELSDLFVVAVPEDWSTYHQSVTAVGGAGSHGTVVLTEQRLASRDDPAGSRERVRAMQEGKVPAMLIDRRAVTKGMTCESFGDKARGKLLAWIAEEPLLGEDFELLGEPELQPIELDRCKGWRVQVRARNIDGELVHLDLHAVAKGETAFLLGLRGPAEGWGEADSVFRELVGTLRMAPPR